MAGLPVQIGDLIAMAKVAQSLLDYGWGKYSNAARQHDAFYRDVDDLYRSLLSLDAIIADAGRELRQQLTTHSSQLRLRCDWRSLSEIIGDCKATLDDCKELLSRNMRFATSSGPVQNIQWNLFVQKDVDALRQRIRQHVEKIALAKDVLKLDLLGRIQEDIRRMHWDIVSRIESLHNSFLELQRDLRRTSDNVTVETLSTSVQHHLTFTTPSLDVTIPDTAERFFDSAFTNSDAPLGVPSLKDLSNVFLAHFYESTYRFQPGLDLQRQPPNDQYINLLKSIWLMSKIQSSEELANAVSTDSHWPSFIKELDKQLSRQCARFSNTWEGLERPRQPDINAINTKIWPPRTVSGRILDQVVKEESLEEILRTKVNHDSENSTVDLSVFRRVRTETDSHAEGDEFRICFSLGNGVPSLSGDLQSLDFSLKMAVLVPAYAVGPDARFRNNFIVETGPTSMSKTSTQLSFQSPKGMAKFQHALTGYKVWDHKTFYASVKMVYKSGPKGKDIPSLDACLQLWIPRRLEAKLQSDATSGPASPSTDSAVSMTVGRRYSVLSKANSWAPSIAATFNTINTVGSTQTMVVPMEGRNPGFLHVRPDKPLLVLFTNHPTTGERLMVTMEVDNADVNPKRCDCDRNDSRSKECTNVAIERGAGQQGDAMIGIKRFHAMNGAQQDWDVSRLAYERRGEADLGRNAWTDLTRLTIKFHSPDDRRRFSGERCACKKRGKKETRTELQNCVKLGHRGLLGEVKMHYGLEVWNYDEQRKQRQHVVYRE